MTEDPAVPWPEDLARRAQEGDVAALRTLLAAHLPELSVFVRLNVGRDVLARESVSDVTQSVAADLLPELGRESFADRAGFRAWLRRAALNKIIDKQRHHRAGKRDVHREAGVSPSVAGDFDLAAAVRALSTPSAQAMRAEDARILERALERLPEDQRQAVTMARLLGMPHSEIAAALGRTEPASRMLLRRGMVNLARELERIDQGGVGRP